MDSELSGNVAQYRELFERAEGSPEYWSTVAAHEFVRELSQRMEEQAISRAELARRLGTSKAYVTKVLSADVNFTLATLQRLAAAVGGMVYLRIVDREGKGGREQPPTARRGGES